MTTVAEPEPDLARLRPLFVLEKLSWRLRSDVLADGSIISACGFKAMRPAQLTNDIVVTRDELFAAFRNASTVPVTYQLHDLKGALIDATISINEDGSGTVEIAGKKMRFPWITLLSSDAAERLAQLDQYLHRYPLSDGDAASLRARIARLDFSDDDFRAAATLFKSSPETFTERLVDKVRRQEGENRIAPVDVLPDDDRYWNHLLPPVAGSMTLADYIGQELNAAWRDGLEVDPVRALRSLAITFAAPELVPRAPLQGSGADATADAIEAVSKVEDPFSLVGAFEICADRATQGQRFVKLGDRLGQAKPCGFRYRLRSRRNDADADRAASEAERPSHPGMAWPNANGDLSGQCVRVRRKVLSFADADRPRDHRGSLVGAKIFRTDQPKRTGWIRRSAGRSKSAPSRRGQRDHGGRGASRAVERRSRPDQLFQSSSAVLSTAGVPSASMSKSLLGICP